MLPLVRPLLIALSLLLLAGTAQAQYPYPEPDPGTLGVSSGEFYFASAVNLRRLTNGNTPARKQPLDIFPGPTTSAVQQVAHEIATDLAILQQAGGSPWGIFPDPFVSDPAPRLAAAGVTYTRASWRASYAVAGQARYIAPQTGAPSRTFFVNGPGPDLGVGISWYPTEPWNAGAEIMFVLVVE